MEQTQNDPEAGGSEAPSAAEIAADGVFDTGTDEPPGDSATTDPNKRYWLTNDVMALFSVVAYFGTAWAAGAGFLDPAVLEGMSGQAMVAFAVASVGWAFGVDLVERFIA